MKKVIRVTESELIDLISSVVNEQQVSMKEKTINHYPCIPKTMNTFVNYVIDNRSRLMKDLNLDYKNLKLFTKVSIGIIGRESKFGKYTTSLDNRSEILRGWGFGPMIDWGMKKIGKQQSLGLGQITPDFWKENRLDKIIGDYNLSFDSISQGLAVLYSLTNRYKKALKNGLKTEPSKNKILEQYGVINGIDGTGNHALDMSILSHNMREEITLFPYCETNHPLYAGPCNRTKVKPYTEESSFNPENSSLLRKVTDHRLKKFPGELTVDRSKIIPNYFPNLRGPSHSGIGYVEEVSKYVKKFNCF